MSRRPFCTPADVGKFRTFKESNRPQANAVEYQRPEFPCAADGWPPQFTCGPGGKLLRVASTIPPEPLPLAGCPRCHYPEARDVAIHGGRSLRRDCAKCGRFLAFPVWYGQESKN